MMGPPLFDWLKEKRSNELNWQPKKEDQRTNDSVKWNLIRSWSCLSPCPLHVMYRDCPFVNAKERKEERKKGRGRDVAPLNSKWRKSEIFIFPAAASGRRRNLIKALRQRNLIWIRYRRPTPFDRHPPKPRTRRRTDTCWGLKWNEKNEEVNRSSGPLFLLACQLTLKVPQAPETRKKFRQILNSIFWATLNDIY